MAQPKTRLIQDDTVLLPDVIASQVVREVEVWAGGELPDRETLVTSLSAKAQHIYEANKRFRNKLRSKSNAGRDYLYTFMRHWLYAELNGLALGNKIPSGFANGKPIGLRKEQADVN